MLMALRAIHAFPRVPNLLSGLGVFQVLKEPLEIIERMILAL